MQAQSFGAPATAPAMNQTPAASGSAGGVTTPAAQPKQQRVRARRGQATDPHSIAERVWFYYSFTPYIFYVFVMFSFLISAFSGFLFCGQLRRERIAERMKALQELVPNANKVISPSPK